MTPRLLSLFQLRPLTLGSVMLVTMSGAANAEMVKASPAQQVALRNEARIHEHGEGVRRDTAKAIQLYCEASRLGDSESQYSLGWMYANGRGVPRDDATAAFFFDMAAKQGHPQAQRMLRQVGDPVTKPPECLFDSDGRDIVAKATPDHRKVMEMVTKLAPEYGVYPRLALAVIRTESNFNAGAVSPKNHD